jgi:hypothetical protein
MRVEPLILLYCISVGIVFAILSPFLYWRQCMEMFWHKVEQPDYHCRHLNLYNDTETQNTLELNVANIGMLLQVLYQCYCSRVFIDLSVEPVYTSFDRQPFVWRLDGWSNWTQSSNAGCNDRMGLWHLRHFIYRTSSCAHNASFLECIYVNYITLFSFILYGISLVSFTGGKMVIFSGIFSTIADEVNVAKKVNIANNNSIYNIF